MSNKNSNSEFNSDNSKHNFIFKFFNYNSNFNLNFVFKFFNFNLKFILTVLILISILFASINVSAQDLSKSSKISSLEKLEYVPDIVAMEIPIYGRNLDPGTLIPYKVQLEGITILSGEYKFDPLNPEYNFGIILNLREHLKPVASEAERKKEIKILIGLAGKESEKVINFYAPLKKKSNDKIEINNSTAKDDSVSLEVKAVVSQSKEAFDEYEFDESLFSDDALASEQENIALPEKKQSSGFNFDFSFFEKLAKQVMDFVSSLLKNVGLK